MLKEHTKQHKDSFIQSDIISEYTLSNNRKVVINKTFHNNIEYINIRHYVKTMDHQNMGNNGWIPTVKGLFLNVEATRTFWDDLDKQIRVLLDIPRV